MIRRLFSILAAISLLLLLLSVALSIDGCWRSDGFSADWKRLTNEWNGDHIAEYYLGIGSDHAGARILYEYQAPPHLVDHIAPPSHSPPRRPGFDVKFFHQPVSSSISWSDDGGVLGFRWWIVDYRPRMFLGVIRLPAWLLIFTTTPLPLLWVYFHRRWRRNPSACRSCGYDLRGTPDRCPECGVIPANALT